MNHADLILSQLKSEMALLDSELDNCLKDADYENAHFYQKSIRNKRLEIDALERRMQPNFEKISNCKINIKFAQHSIKRYKEQQGSSEGSERRQKLLNDYIEKSKNKLNEHLEELSLLQKDNICIQVDSDIVLDEVEKLLHSDKKEIVIEIFQHGLLNYITVAKKGSMIEIETLDSSSIPKQRRQRLHAKNYLERMQFQKDDFERWCLCLDAQNTTRDKIMFVIASVIFDVIRPASKAKYNLIV